MTRPVLKAVALLLVLPWSSQNSARAFQHESRGVRKPETASAEDFDPKSLARLAVLVVGKGNPRDAQTNLQRLVEDRFVEVLIAKGHSVVARSDLETILKEQGFQKSGLTEDNAAAVGKLLNVPAVMVVRLNDVKADAQRESNSGTPWLVGRAALGARLISVESGAIWWHGKHSESGEIASQGETNVILLKTTDHLAGAFPEKAPKNDAATDGRIDPKTLAKLAVIVIGEEAHRNRLEFDGNLNPNRRTNVQADLPQLVEDEFVQALMRKGYRLVSRSDIQAVAKEQRFQKSGLTEENAVALGKLLNVPAVLVVRITQFAVENQTQRGPRGKTTTFVGARASVGARLLDVKSGLIWWARSRGTSDAVAVKGDSTAILAEVARYIASTFPPVMKSGDSSPVQEAGKVDRARSRSLLNAAGMLERAGKTEEALAGYRQLIGLYPTTPEAEKAAVRVQVLTGK